MKNLQLKSLKIVSRSNRDGNYDIIRCHLGKLRNHLGKLKDDKVVIEITLNTIGNCIEITDEFIINQIWNKLSEQKLPEQQL